MTLPHVDFRLRPSRRRRKSADQVFSDKEAEHHHRQTDDHRGSGDLSPLHLLKIDVVIDRDNDCSGVGAGYRQREEILVPCLYP